MKFLVKGIFLYVILMLTVKEKNGFLATAWSASNDGSKKWEEINDDVEWIDQNMVAMEEQTQMQISCVSNMDGSRVCDCGFRNEVSFFLNLYMIRVDNIFLMFYL